MIKKIAYIITAVILCSIIAIFPLLPVPYLFYYVSLLVMHL